MMCTRLALVGATLWGVFCWSHAIAAPYTPVVFATPAVGPGVITPASTFGKEYSRKVDEDFMGTADPEQVVAWDGVGGTLDGLDYSLTRPVDFPREQEVDAIANSRDALFNEARSDRAHLVFSHTDVVGRYVAGGFVGFGPVAPLVGPVTLSNGDTILGAAELSVEEAGTFAGFEVQHGWAPVGSINSMAPPTDLDGIEVWGPEPGVTADSNKYSLETDIIGGGGISVWSYDLGTGVSVPYIPHGTIVGAVTSLLGAVPTTAFDRNQLPSFEAVNLDALMVMDSDGVDLQFGGLGDSIIFSIGQIVDPADPDGYYATGSEIFVLEAGAAGPAASFLRHGGHVWDHAYTLASMGIAGLPAGERAFIDINGLEAIGERLVPEPGTYLLLGLALATGALHSRRRKS